MTKYKFPVCRGSIALGSACRKCERCEEELSRISFQSAIAELKEQSTDQVEPVLSRDEIDGITSAFQWIHRREMAREIERQTLAKYRASVSGAEPFGTFGGRRYTPEGTLEFWGTLNNAYAAPSEGINLYEHPSISGEALGMLSLIADIRKAAGDPAGKLMQDELVAHIASLAATAPAQGAVPEGWEQKVFDAMDNAFRIRRERGSRADGGMVIDDTQIGVEFAIAQIKALLTQETSR